MSWYLSGLIHGQIFGICQNTVCRHKTTPIVHFLICLMFDFFIYISCSLYQDKRCSVLLIGSNNMLFYYNENNSWLTTYQLLSCLETYSKVCKDKVKPTYIHYFCKIVSFYLYFSKCRVLLLLVLGKCIFTSTWVQQLCTVGLQI